MAPPQSSPVTAAQWRRRCARRDLRSAAVFLAACAALLMLAQTSLPLRAVLPFARRAAPLTLTTSGWGYTQVEQDAPPPVDWRVTRVVSVVAGDADLPLRVVVETRLRGPPAGPSPEPVSRAPILLDAAGEELAPRVEHLYPENALKYLRRRMPLAWWGFLGVLAAWGALSLSARRSARAWWLARRALCPRCGFDLRTGSEAASDRCPECGLSS